MTPLTHASAARLTVDRPVGAFTFVSMHLSIERATRDPADTTRFLPRYDSGDHLHPKDAGYKAMGESIDLQLFNTTPAVVT